MPASKSQEQWQTRSPINNTPQIRVQEEVKELQSDWAQQKWRSEPSYSKLSEKLKNVNRPSGSWVTDQNMQIIV